MPRFRLRGIAGNPCYYAYNYTCYILAYAITPCNHGLLDPFYTSGCGACGELGGDLFGVEENVKTGPGMTYIEKPTPHTITSTHMHKPRYHGTLRRKDGFVCKGLSCYPVADFKPIKPPSRGRAHNIEENVNKELWNDVGNTYTSQVWLS